MELSIHQSNVVPPSRDTASTIIPTYLKFKNSDELPTQLRVKTLQKNKSTQVLLADDDEQAREQLELQLIACKCSVNIASSGVAALKAVEDNPDIDIVILNWMMPGLSGLLTARIIKKIAPQIHVLVIVGEKFVQAVEAIFPSWADGYIQKPFNPFSLKDILSHLALVREHNPPDGSLLHGKITIRYDATNMSYSNKNLLGA